MNFKPRKCYAVVDATGEIQIDCYDSKESAKEWAQRLGGRVVSVTIIPTSKLKKLRKRDPNTIAWPR